MIKKIKIAKIYNGACFIFLNNWNNGIISECRASKAKHVKSIRL